MSSQKQKIKIKLNCIVEVYKNRIYNSRSKEKYVDNKCWKKVEFWNWMRSVLEFSGFIIWPHLKTFPCKSVLSTRFPYFTFYFCLKFETEPFKKMRAIPQLNRTHNFCSNLTLQTFQMRFPLKNGKHNCVFINICKNTFVFCNSRHSWRNILMLASNISGCWRRYLVISFQTFFTNFLFLSRPACLRSGWYLWKTQISLRIC